MLDWSQLRNQIDGHISLPMMQKHLFIIIFCSTLPQEKTTFKKSKECIQQLCKWQAYQRKGKATHRRSSTTKRRACSMTKEALPTVLKPSHWKAEAKFNRDQRSSKRTTFKTKKKKQSWRALGLRKRHQDIKTKRISRRSHTTTIDIEQRRSRGGKTHGKLHQY